MLRRGTAMLARCLRTTHGSAAAPSLCVPAVSADATSHTIRPAFLVFKGANGHHTRQIFNGVRNRGYTHFDDPSTLAYASANRRPLLLVIGSGCVAVWVLSQQEVPYTGRRHAILVPASAEKAMGHAAFQQVLAKAKEEGTLLPRGSPQQARVERIGRRIQAVASDSSTGGGYQDHMQGLDWEFVVIANDQLNAFVVPGGKVVVFAKMLDVCRTDDELASVIAHEAGHVLARHTGERLTAHGWITIAQLAFFFVMGFGLPNGILELTLALPNSRSPLREEPVTTFRAELDAIADICTETIVHLFTLKQESEADVIGMTMAAQACFDPAAGKQVFTRLGAIEKRMGGGMVPTMLRTHPLSEKRVAAIEAHLPEARQWAERSGCGMQQQHFYDFFR